MMMMSLRMYPTLYSYTILRLITREDAIGVSTAVGDDDSVVARTIPFQTPHIFSHEQ